MRKYLIVAAIAAGLASPASAQLYPNPFDQALQNYQVDQGLNALAAQTMRNYQNSVNQGLNRINPQPSYGRRCPVWQYC